MARFNPVTESESPTAPAADPVASAVKVPRARRNAKTSHGDGSPKGAGRKPKVLRSGRVPEQIRALPERALGYLAEELGRSDLNALRQEFAAYAEAHPEFSDWRKAWAAYKTELAGIADGPNRTHGTHAATTHANNVLVIPVTEWQRSTPVEVPVVPAVQLSTLNHRRPRIGLPNWRRT